jgi:hypothetical protein
MRTVRPNRRLADEYRVEFGALFTPALNAVSKSFDRWKSRVIKLNRAQFRRTIQAARNSTIARMIRMMSPRPLG